ncbi:MAG: hypothetical protein GX568_00095 [Candidatus Gastranaerophilales bacterium]|nr:hypothetical protein [Candidatus Gastranaerophilales bacterium]
METLIQGEFNYRKEGNPLKRLQTTHFRHGWYVWELVTDMDLTVDMLADIQAKQGYPVNPYGLYSPQKFARTYKNGKTEYKYTWKCATNSD